VIKQNIKLPPGKRLTEAKQTIVDFLYNNKGHYTAEQLHKTLQELLPNLGLATIYRNLNDLVYSGILNQLSYPGLPLQYEYSHSKHAHFYCEYCRKIYDLNIPSSNLDNIKQWEGHYIKGVNVELQGICKNCVNNYFG